MIKTAFSKSKRIEHEEFMTQQLAVPNPVSATKKKQIEKSASFFLKVF
jgi:hypothetical protein